MTPAEQMREAAAQICEERSIPQGGYLTECNLEAAKCCIAIRALHTSTSASPADALLTACVTALEGVVRVADRKTDEFDVARSALSAARAYLGRT